MTPGSPQTSGRGLGRVLLALALALPPAAAAQGGGAGLTLIPPPQSVKVYARDGSLIAEIGPQARTWVSLRSLPRHVARAFVAVEDRRFYEHVGVDPVGIARAVKSTVEGERQGASTITQQLIGAMYPDRVDRREMTLERKVREAELALALERRYGKDRILEAYLNQIYFGHGWFGIEAAARHYFGKPAARLNLEETAMLAALPKGPGVYSPKLNPQRALERRNLVLDILAREGVAGAAEVAAAKRRPIRLAPNHGYSTRPPWVIEQVRQFLEQRYGPRYGMLGLRVWTTLDPVAQNAADSALAAGLRRVERQPWFRGARYGTPAARAGAGGTNYLQGLVVSLDARTGEILAMTGGRDWEQSRFNRVTAARRQPGSAFKPFVYAAALERGVSPATRMQDTALQIRLAGSPVYRPKNSDEVFRGPVTVRDALTHSINTVSIQLGMQMGLPRVAEAARRFGITTPVPPYPSSVLGAGVVRPLELAAAYTAFANRGMRVEPFLVRRVADAGGRTLFDARGRGVRVLSPEVAFLVTDMLRDAAERGTGTEARERLPARIPMAGKTGTTDDGTDVWYVGFTPEMVTAVWVGFDTPRTIGSAAFGGTLSAPIWGDMMRQVYARRRTPAPWPVPAGISRVAVDSAGTPLTAPCPVGPVRTEYFLAGTEPRGACVLREGILLPAGDTLPADSILLDSLPADTLAGDTLAAPLPPRR
ncbi:MAG TPA: PBP1A family penicillin-binding protein [Longimicrobiaceae bacterium]|nr:PBP1A family penicillin-binding protein [Longimicrobiaceae bacterium]